MTTPTSGGASLDDAGVLIGAELIGVSEAANQTALDYAQAREVFGKPLSKFQVTRHKAVDMLREIELARVGVHYAAWAADVDAPDREIAAASAKAYAAHAANYVTAECIQIHGGVGYTWECDAHLFLRRAKVNDLLLGYQGWQRSPRRRSLFRGSLALAAATSGPPSPVRLRAASGPTDLRLIENRRAAAVAYGTMAR